jgi:hypothetical protein
VPVQAELNELRELDAVNPVSNMAVAVRILAALRHDLDAGNRRASTKVRKPSSETANGQPNTPYRKTKIDHHRKRRTRNNHWQTSP